MLMEGQGVNALNHLTIGGCDSVELCEKCGTPLYVMDENLVREHCRLYKNSIDECYDGNGLVEMQKAIYDGNEITFTTAQEYTSAKVMVWNSISGLKPVCDAEFINHLH